MATNPSFAATPRIATAIVSTAETNYQTITNFQTLISGASTGTRVAEVVCKAAGTSAVGIIRLYSFDSVTNILVDEVTISAAASGNTVASTRVSTTYNNWILPNTAHSIRVTTTIAQPIHVTAFGADL
jgi:hypothetical protein